MDSYLNFGGFVGYLCYWLVIDCVYWVVGLNEIGGVDVVVGGFVLYCGMLCCFDCVVVSIVV